MLLVAFDYCTVIDNVTGNKTLKLRQYELDDGDWEIVRDLLRVLKVSTLLCCVILVNSTSLLDVQGCHSLLLSR